MVIKILAGFANTFILTISCFITASLLGCLTCAGFCSKNKTMRAIVNIYNSIVIKIPPLVMLMIFALVIGGTRNQGSMLIAYVGLSIFVAANLAGVFYGGVCAVDKGEIESARTLGFTKYQAFFHVVLPQAIQNIVPVYMSMFVMCMQVTSVSSVIGVSELMGVANGIENAWISVAVAVASYFLIGTLGDIAITRMGKRRHIRSRDFSS